MGKWEIVCMKGGFCLCVCVCFVVFPVRVCSTGPSRMHVYSCVCVCLWLRHKEEV